ncbi:hypothetical protein [Halopiger goleimassiliensis]|uniref:hypothetical protein n=1 Tax=Halopiger goleimassiliensis TaxID=1293048 RepID=UPI0006775E3F|nr:hypothetical protein [Halopiger goleimassiliensis]
MATSSFSWRDWATVIAIFGIVVSISPLALLGISVALSGHLSLFGVGGVETDGSTTQGIVTAIGVTVIAVGYGTSIVDYLKRGYYVLAAVVVLLVVGAVTLAVADVFPSLGTPVRLGIVLASIPLVPLGNKGLLEVREVLEAARTDPDDSS